MADNQPVQESWNMATETLKRLSRSLDLCSYFSQKGDLVQWFYTSMDLRRNIYPFLEEPEFKAIETKINELPNGWIRNGKVFPKHYVLAHKTLDELYMLFIKNMKAKGLLMPKTTDPRASVVNM